MANQQIAMIEVSVVVAVNGVDPEEHFLYLAPFSDRRAGAETVADYLSGRRRFFPMVSGGSPKMINRDQILWVRYEKLPEALDFDETMSEKLTIVELTEGTRIEGVVPIFDRPREQSRLSDVLNDVREEFLRIDDDAETYYVNKAFIRRVIPR